MINSRLIRTLICLALVCCILVNQVPVRAEATGGGLGALISGATVAAPAGPVIAAILIGLGIFAVANSPAFDNLVNTVKTKLAHNGLVNNDTIDTVQVAGGTLQDPIYAVPESLVEDVLDEVYASGVVSVEKLNGFPVGAGDKIKFGGYGIRPSMDCFGFVYSTSITSAYCTLILYSTNPDIIFYDAYFNFDVTKSKNTLLVDDVNYYYAYESVNKSAVDLSYPVFNGNTPAFLTAVLSGEFDPSVDHITVADGLTVGQIAPQGSSIAAGYPTWGANSFKYQDEEDMYYPIGLGATYEDTVTKTQEDVWAGMSEYTSEVLTNWQSLLNMLSAIKTAVTGLWGSISGWFTDVIAETAAIPDAFASWFEQMIEYGSSILDTLKGLAGSIADAIVEALTAAFALDEAYMRAEFDALLSDFKFLDSMVDFGRGVVDVFYGIGSKPPILYVDLDAAESEFDYGDRVVFLDLTWYERYKPYGDAIISSFLWAWFGWRLLHSLPGLINGSSGAVPHINFRKWGD